MIQYLVNMDLPDGPEVRRNLLLQMRNLAVNDAVAACSVAKTAADDAFRACEHAIEARVADAPRANEIVVAIAVTDSGRPHPRVGGLAVTEIKGQDGLR